MAEAPAPSRWTQLLPALVGLAGVLIGALVTSGIAYLGAEHRRDDDRRAAIRLVVVEIRADEYALYLKLTGVTPPPAVTTAAWRSEQGTLARYLPADQWNALATFYGWLQLSTFPKLHGGCRSPAFSSPAPLEAYKSAAKALIALRAHLPGTPPPLAAPC